MINVTLSNAEMEILFQQNPATARRGGYQSLLVGLQKRTDRKTGTLQLTASDLERIRRYAFTYGNGGWENRLKSIFESHLGPTLSEPQSN